MDAALVASVVLDSRKPHQGDITMDRDEALAACPDPHCPDLRWADLRWADLRRAGLTDANPTDAKLTGAKLDGADNPSEDDISNAVWAACRDADLPFMHDIYIALLERGENFTAQDAMELDRIIVAGHYHTLVEPTFDALDDLYSD